MRYTVKKLAKLSGVSIRTLHFYDEIGLLKPAYYGHNHYRYYEEKQLLLLQQILFYRELGFELSNIKQIINAPDFDKLKALESHREILTANISQANQLLKTVDKTIDYLRGKTTMKLEEVFEGFSDEKQKLYEDFLIKKGVSKDEIARSKEKVKHWDKARWLAHKKEADDLHEQFLAAITQGLSASSPEVQSLVKKHYDLTTHFWTPTKETYIGLSELYSSHPDFIRFYDNLDPRMLKFLSEAMKIYAEKF